MQEMFSAVCDGARVGDEGQLEDERDNKIYWIAKLRDGNCWMTQNLDLDIPVSGLTAELSDMIVDWDSSSTYKPVATQITATPSFGTTNNNIVSWDPALGGAATYCNDGGAAGKCKASGNSTTSINDGHDAQGNYYSWGAATAGQAASLTSTTSGEQSTQSICPKGWKLPTSNTNGEFYNLVNGLTVAQITTSPYYFVYGGYVAGSNLSGAGSQGWYWSSTANGANRAYFLYFATSVNPSNNSNRYLGLSVRCVAK